jgi:hypothetical protein
MSFGISSAVFGQEVHVQFENALKTGNVKTFAKLFDTKIDILMDNESKSYSQQQAQVVLNDFISELKNVKFELIHSGVSKTQSKYFIGKIISDKAIYRVYIFLKKVNGGDFIQEIKFEKQ